MGVVRLFIIVFIRKGNSGEAPNNVPRSDGFAAAGLNR